MQKHTRTTEYLKLPCRDCWTLVLLQSSLQVSWEFDFKAGLSLRKPKLTPASEQVFGMGLQVKIVD